MTESSYLPGTLIVSERLKAAMPSPGDALQRLTARTPTHQTPKVIDPVAVAHALANEPFGTFSSVVAAYQAAAKGNDGCFTTAPLDVAYDRGAENFLRNNFPIIASLPEISFELSDWKVKEEREVLSRLSRAYEAGGLKLQSAEVMRNYEAFALLRRVFGKFRSNIDRRMETIIPIQYLPEILMATPVWFVQARGQDLDNWTHLHFSRYMCSLGASQEFAHLFQMYNSEPRSFGGFRGRDIVPPTTATLIQEIRNDFDYLVITTPYHDLASDKWGQRHWVRNIDPYLFGFTKEVPSHFFFLDRWSGNGIFPLIGDLIADTAEHIKRNLTSLSKVGSIADWNFGNVIGTKTLGIGELAGYARRLMKAYDEKRLFPFLRGELTPAS